MGRFLTCPSRIHLLIGMMERSILTFVEDVYEDLELWYPLLRLQEAGLSLIV